MGMVAPGKRAFFRFARVGMGWVAPGKRRFLYFARVEMGATTPGKRHFLYIARAEMGWLPLANENFGDLPGAHGENQRTNDIHLLMQDRPYLTNQNRAANSISGGAPLFSLLY